MYIPLLDSISRSSAIKEVSALMDKQPKNELNHQPWPEFKSNSKTSFAISHSGDAIFLKYFVKEDVIKIVMHKTNDQVYKDNCVEFFIAFGLEKEYYNIELNCLGVCAMAYGESRINRNILSEELINKIQTSIIIETATPNSATKFEWEITLLIPIEVFGFSNIRTFSGQNGKGNFFKCGDDLPEPHFLSWKNINAKTPNFHLPEFFGALEFG
ncbi:hypothetical protein AAKU52_002280 [Pedobacter sp. CG_S7]|uniref:carbohydrate-binding family 9-like protein n=1 Tax=Pedobacter sp. CG_S7 TaxID=3143930 RepID=UPI0033985845